MKKNEYKYELHCHTSEVSRCAASSAKEAVEYYKNRGYDGIVITNHYSPQTFFFVKSFQTAKIYGYVYKRLRKSKAARRR